MSKWLVKHKSIKFSLKITNRKTHVFIDIRWPWIWIQWFYLVIWNDDRTKIIVLHSFQSLNDEIRRTEMKLRLLMKSGTLICIWILVFPIGIIEVSTSQTWHFLHYFSSLHDFWPPSTWKSLVHTSLGKMERCEKRAFQLIKMRKKKMSWNIQTKCITDF